MILSGGNVDAGLLASVARLHESRVGRRLVIFTRIADRPGGAGAAARAPSRETRANLVNVEHVREGVDLHVRETGVQLVARDARARARRRGARGAARERGYEASRVRG